MNIQKQPSRGVPRKRCSKTMQQIYRRTPMPKCNFSKDAKQLMFSCTFVAYFQNNFSQEHRWVAASEYILLCNTVLNNLYHSTGN